MNLIDPSGLVGKEFRYKSKYGGVIYDTIVKAFVIYNCDVTTVKVDEFNHVKTLKDAIEGVKVNGKHYSKKQSYAYPQIVIKSSNGVNYDFNETITIKL